ncbi:MAG: redoxin domain-containing protein [Chloroflexi bacterium]|nr:redoxin domain-containing protein [Chloroflexota bacterium]
MPCRDHVGQLAPHCQEIRALHGEVVTLSFGSEYWARPWLQEMASPFPFLVDPERAAYHAFGLQPSVLRSWMPQNLWYDVRVALQGRETFGKRGDPQSAGRRFYRR